MSIKSNLHAETATAGRYALVAPQAGDIISGALKQAFATPAEERDLLSLLAQIDRVDRGRA